MNWQEEMLLDRYGITPADLVRGGLHCEPETIQPDVVLLPNWRAEIFEAYVDSLQTIVPNTVYEVRVGEKRVTFIRAGIGAPALALGAWGGAATGRRRRSGCRMSCTAWNLAVDLPIARM